MRSILMAAAIDEKLHAKLMTFWASATKLIPGVYWTTWRWDCR